MYSNNELVMVCWALKIEGIIINTPSSLIKSQKYDVAIKEIMVVR